LKLFSPCSLLLLNIVLDILAWAIRQGNDINMKGLVELSLFAYDIILYLEDFEDSDS
jgi:hypothetical protein